jgi:hypothetical protein
MIVGRIEWRRKAERQRWYMFAPREAKETVEFILRL